MQPVAVEPDDELDLRHYIDVVWRRKVIIIVTAVIVTAIAVGLSLTQEDRYRASTRLLLQGNQAEQRLGVTDDATRSNDNRVSTEIGVIESDVVSNAVEEELGFEPDISASPEGDTDIIELSATSTDPQEAAEVANTYAEVFVDWRRQRIIEDLLDAQQTVQEEIDNLQAQVDELEAPIDDLENQLATTTLESEREAIQAEIDDLEDQISAQRDQLTSQIALYQSELSSLQVSQRITSTGGVQIVGAAQVPTSPFEPQPLRNGVLGAVVGLMLGVGLAFVFETLDDRVRSKERLERVTGWPTVGLIPVIAKGKSGRDLITVEHPTSPTAEAYRSLRTAVQFLGLERPLSVIQVTSANSGDGKTTTAANLAVMLAKSNDRVLLIDADLRRPRMHEEFDIPNTKGFTSILLGESAVEDTFHRTGEDGLVVMPSGPPPPNPAELLAMPRTRDLLDRLREYCDVIVIDSPPVLPVTDPIVLSRSVDGVLLVTDAATARARELTRTREILEQVQAPVIGITVNRIAADADYSYGYGYYYEAGYYTGPPPGATYDEEPDDGSRRRVRIGRR